MINLILYLVMAIDLVIATCLWLLCGVAALSIPDREGLRFDAKLAEYLGVALFPIAVLYLYTVKNIQINIAIIESLKSSTTRGLK